MNEEYEKFAGERASLDAVDEDPPRESEQFRQLDEITQSADDDDDPPVEASSPWDEVEPSIEQLARHVARADSSAEDEDPPAEPSSVTSIPRAPINRLELEAKRQTAERFRPD
jgi:hypothetical protein